MGRGIAGQEANGQAQALRVAKALALEGDLVWTKTPLGWSVQTPSGKTYLVARNSCGCPDFQHRCSGTERVCYHICALRRKLAIEEQPGPAVKPAQAPKPSGWEAMSVEQKDQAFDRIFGGG